MVRSLSQWSAACRGSAWGDLARSGPGGQKHPTFGVQFKAEAFERYKPETASAMLKYLSSGAVKGIGPKYGSEDCLSVRRKYAAHFGGRTGAPEHYQRDYKRKGAQNGGKISPGSWSAGCYGSALRLWSYSPEERCGFGV